MSIALDIRDELVTLLTAAVTTAGKAITVKAAQVMVVELEDETGTILEVAPMTVARLRDYRLGWTRTYTIRCVLRRQGTGRNPSQIASIEEAFFEDADWLGDTLEGIAFVGPYGITEIADADIALRETYMESGQLVSIIDINVMTVV